MRLKSVIAGALMTPAVALAWPWSTDMMNQPSIKPQEGSMVPFPERSIPATGIPTKVASREETREMASPVTASPESIDKGRTLYKIYCAVCHGLTGGADSPVAAKIGAIALHDSYVQENLSEGWIWGTITFGSYVMPAYGVPQGKRGSNDLNVEERWHVVNYVKHGLTQDHAAAASTAAVK